VQSEFLIVAEQLLQRERRAMSPRELVDLALKDRLFSDKIAGKTPFQTMKSKLSVHVRRHGEGSVFVRTRPGRFYLRRLLGGTGEIYYAAPLRPPPPTEQVLVFPTHWLRGTKRFQGIRTKGTDRFIKGLVRSGILSYVDRAKAEQVNDHKQIITYVMVTRGEDILAYKRGHYTNVEDFLKGQYCIGFGGHVSASDLTLFGQSNFGIVEAAARELKEELDLPAGDKRRLENREGLEIVGMLNDDASANGRRHFAVVLRYEVSDDPSWSKPARNEKSITQLRWLNPSASSHRLFQFEYWSQLCLVEFHKSSEITEPTFTIRHPAPLKPPHLLVLLGELGSGKSAAADVLRGEYSYSVINSGRVLADLIGEDPVEGEAGRRPFHARAWEFIQQEAAPQRLAAAIWERVESASSGRVLVDGIRQHSTLAHLRLLAGHLRVGVIYVHTPFNIAFQFYKSRASERKTIDDFIEARSAPVETEVGSLVREADAILYNWRGAAAYKSVVRALMDELGVSP
jgi:predicted NUDIX family phosphoesterase/dephospho-CoA kinase